MEPNIVSIPSLFLGLFLSILCFTIYYLIKRKNFDDKINKILSDALREAEKRKVDALQEIKETTYKLKQEADEEIKERKSGIKEQEERIRDRETSVDKREELLQMRSNNLDKREDDLLNKQKELQEKESKVEETLKLELIKLEDLSGLSKDKARSLVLKKVEEAMSKELAEYIKEKETEAKLKANSIAKGMIVEAMQRYSADVTNEQTVSTISLPNDEMKGRLIGREGRNIRTIESVTGVDLIIDDTPEAIVISSFDPLRREIAKITIETLIKDGRIHPGRIEELYDKVCSDMNDKILEMGNSVVYELGLSKMEPELITLIGKLNFRTSYGQNALQHSKEVAYLTGLMAEELGENVTLARRAGLLHDIGKSIDFEVEGSHVELGSMMAKKYHEEGVVINTIESHHGDTDPTSIIAVLVQVADSLSAARPGARNDSFENYVKRLEQLEAIGNSFSGVEKTYAMQAGREIRVMVKPNEVTDQESFKMARDIKERIEKEMQYPGTVKITVVRETRAQEEAR